MTAPSVAVCTYRHGPELIDTLRSVDADAAPEAELVVVRSGVAPGAPLPQSLREWISAAERPVQVLAVPELGSGAARSAAMLHVTAPVVLFADDDVIVQPGWYRALAAALADGAAAAGGTILPEWPNGRPAWLPSRLASFYGERFPGAYGQPLPFGANLALRREAVEAVGGFRTDLGTRGGTPALHDETELCARLMLAGYRVLLDVPEAVVHHRVRPDQVRIRWLLRRAWHEGRSDARRDGVRRDQLILHASKLAGLVAALPFSLVRRRWAVYVAGRATVNLGYGYEAVRSVAGRSE